MLFEELFEGYGKNLRVKLAFSEYWLWFLVNSIWDAVIKLTGLISFKQWYKELYITPLCSLLHTLLKDKCMCLQDEWKLYVTRPAGQVQYWNIFVPCIWLVLFMTSQNKFEYLIKPSLSIKPIISKLRYSKTCVKWPLSKRPKIGFQDQLSLNAGSENAGQKYCRMLQGEHSAILLTFIKLPFGIKIFVFSIFEWPLKTGFTVPLSCL